MKFGLMFTGIASRIRRLQMKTHKPIGGQASTKGLLVSLGALDRDLAVALAEAFQNCAAVEVVEGSLLNLDCDAIVSPANSFGDMGGGIDKAIDDFHNGAVQEAVMEAIRREFCGELPVGAAIVVELPAKRFRFVVAAPTMRIPGFVGETINAYLSMRGALVAVLQHNESNAKRIHRLAVPGLATRVGGMPFAVAADQMWTAYDNVIGGRWRDIVSPAMAPYAMPGWRLSSPMR